MVLDQDSVIPFNDRTALYGDGCFTTIAVSNKKPELLALHLQRLKRDCDKLFIQFNDWTDLEKTILELSLTQHYDVVKVVISRGQGGRGYSPTTCINSTAYLSLSSIPVHYSNWRKDGVSMGISSIQLAIQPLLAGIKHLNRLEQVLIKRELDKLEYDDVVVCDTNGHVIETSAGNLFWRKADTWFTPNLESSGVIGVMRNHVFDLLKSNNIELKQVVAGVNELFLADEIAISNCLMGWVPVRSLKGTNDENWSNNLSNIQSIFTSTKDN